MNNNWYEMDLEARHHRQELLEQVQKARRPRWSWWRPNPRATDR